MAALTLINAGPSPYGRKVAVALREKNLGYEVRYDLPWSEGSCTPDHSPLQQLPILIESDGSTVYDSSFILTWLEARFPVPALLPIDRDGRLMAKWRQMLGERLMEVAQAIIFENHRDAPSVAWIERQTRKILGGLDELERRYASRSLVADSQIDLGDIAVATTLLVLEHVVKVGLSQDVAAFRWRGVYPALTDAVAMLEQRPSFTQTQPLAMAVDVAATVA